MENFAGVALRDGLLGGLFGAAEATLHGIQQHFAGLGRCFGDPLGFSTVERRRLLADHVLSRAHRRKHYRHMKVGRQTHTDRVDALVLDQLLDVIVFLDRPMLGRQLVPAIRDQIRHRDDLKSTRLFVALRMSSTWPTRSGDPYPYCLRHPESFPWGREL